MYAEDGVFFNVFSLQCEICVCLHVPVGEAKHEKLKEGRVNEQVLVIVVKLRESRQPLRPAACHLHGAG